MMRRLHPERRRDPKRCDKVSVDGYLGSRSQPSTTVIPRNRVVVQKHLNGTFLAYAGRLLKVTYGRQSALFFHVRLTPLTLTVGVMDIYHFTFGVRETCSEVHFFLLFLTFLLSCTCAGHVTWHFFLDFLPLEIRATVTVTSSSAPNSHVSSHGMKDA